MKKVTFVFTCGCIGEKALINQTSGRGAKFCPNHPQRSLKEVRGSCKICGAGISYRPGQYKHNAVLLCRPHKIIKERYDTYLRGLKKRPGRPVIGWDEYLATYQERNGNRMPTGPKNQ